MDKPYEQPEVTVVMPCLNEERTLATCIGKARSFFKRFGITGEIIVADNGSTDASVDIAQKLADRVVQVEPKGYGHALNGGILAANGQYVVMGDADDSYDFSALDEFIRLLREGHDMVIGNRFSGGIRKKAMPWLHRYIGNPLLSGTGRLLFHNRIRDYHCGLRGFSKTAYLRIRPACGGMEFASEMIIKAVLAHLHITETAVTLYPDGRNRSPHLRTWADGYNHLKLMLNLYYHETNKKMKRLIIYIGISLCTAIVPLTSCHRRTRTNKPLSATIVRVEPDSADIGNISPHSLHSACYKLYNIGNEPLHITDVLPSCDCTKATYEPQEAPPGASVTITLTYEAEDFSGYFFRTAEVECNAESPITLTLTGTIVTE